MTFDPTSCVFQDLKTKNTVGSVHEKDKWYNLDPNGSIHHLPRF